MSEGSKRWDAVLTILSVKVPKAFQYLAHGRYREESQFNVTLVAATEADAEEVRKGVRVYEAELELCTTTVYGEKRGVKVTVSDGEFDLAPVPSMIGGGSVVAPATPPLPLPAGVSPPPVPADPKAAMESELRSAVEAEYRAKIEDEVRRRLDAKLREDSEREEARLRAVEAEKGRRLSLLQHAEEATALLARKLFEMKNVAHPEQAWKLRPLLAEAGEIVQEVTADLAQVDRRDDRPEG